MVSASPEQLKTHIIEQREQRVGGNDCLALYKGVLEGAEFRAGLITGQTVMDQADSVLKTWDGSGWRAHW